MSVSEEPMKAVVCGMESHSGFEPSIGLYLVGELQTPLLLQLLFGKMRQTFRIGVLFVAKVCPARLRCRRRIVEMKAG